MQDVEAEVARLTALLQEMKAVDMTVQPSPDSALDSDGQMLRLVLEWRQQRQTAIATELKRLAAC